MNNRIRPPASQPDPLAWLAGNLDTLNTFILAELRRGEGREERLLTEFFVVLRAKRAVHDGLAALRELSGRAAA